MVSAPVAPTAENNAQAAGLCVALALMHSTSPGLQMASGSHGATAYGVEAARQSSVLCRKEDDSELTRWCSESPSESHRL